MIKFKPEKHYLGHLCKNKHDYNGTGQSIRYLKTQACAECQKEAMTKYMKGFKEAKSA